MPSPLYLDCNIPSDHIRAWVAGYAFNKRKWKPLAFLQAYIDDSYSDTGDRRLFLAGYLHNADTWQKFSDEWQNVLNEAPAIDYFKMSEANSLRKQFWGWSEQARDAKIISLIDVIQTFNPVSFHISVNRASYDEILSPVAPYMIPHIIIV